MNATSAVELTKALAWPLVVGIGLIMFRTTLVQFVTMLGKRAKKVEVYSVAIELSTASQVQETPAVTEIRELVPSTPITSNLPALYDQLESTTGSDYVLIDLGRFDQPRWLTSRLYIFAVMLRRMKGVRACVFVDRTDSTHRRYVGYSAPEHVRWALAERYPWLESAYAQAYYSCVAPYFAIPFVKSEMGAVDGVIAQGIVNTYLGLVRGPMGPPDPDWIEITQLNMREHAKWLDTARLEQVLDNVLEHAAIVDSGDLDDAELTRRAIRCRGEFAAIIDPTRTFQRLIDRQLILEQVAKDSERSISQLANGQPD